MARSIIIIGVGPFVSRSLAVKMASLGWHMVLISRSIDKLEDVAAAARKAAGRDTMVLCRTADAGEPAQLLAALDWASKQLGFVDCVCYNAARVGKFVVVLTRLRPMKRGVVVDLLVRRF